MISLIKYKNKIKKKGLKFLFFNYLTFYYANFYIKICYFMKWAYHYPPKSKIYYYHFHFLILKKGYEPILIIFFRDGDGVFILDALIYDVHLKIPIY